MTIQQIRPYNDKVKITLVHLFKKKSQTLCTYYSVYFLSSCLISACSLLGYDARSFASQDLVIFFPADPLKLCQFGREKHIFRSLHRRLWVSVKGSCRHLK